jgi:AraC-like DNA-binding protein
MSDELNEKFSPKQIKQAIGIASDKRYARGNMTGATKTIEKLARGLSDHPQVRAVLRRQNEDVNEKFDPADLDLVATDKDKASAKMNIIMQLRKAADVRGNIPIQFADGKKAKLPPKVIELALKKFASFRKPDSKEKLQTAMGKSYKDMVHALKTMREEVELDEAMFMVTVAKGGPGGKDLNVKVNAKDRMDAAKVFRKSNPRYKNDEISIKESIEEGVDKAKIQKQIDQAEKYLKTFFGNTSSVKMKKVAIQRKIDKLKKQLNEAEEDAKEDYCDCGCECGKEICESCGKPHKPENIKECVNEEVQQDLQEAPNYKLYHNTFSGAVQEAIAVAKKKGFDVDEDDWHDKVATGPKKPSKDKTNSYSIKLMKKGKPVRQMLQIQVYNMGAKYELNCYVQ